MNQNCENFKERIADWLNGNLEKGQQKQVTEHIISCSDCKAFEIALKSEDELLDKMFAGMISDLKRQENDVISAIFCIKTSRTDRIIARINKFIDHPAFKLTAAAAVILFVAFYGLKTMGWLYDIKYLMDSCSIVMK